MTGLRGGEVCASRSLRSQNRESSSALRCRLALTFALTLLCLPTLLACAPEHPIIETCEDAEGVHALCGFQNPEDLALLADGRTVIVSQFGLMDGSRAGSLAILDLEDESQHLAYEGVRDVAARGLGGADSLWGAADCPGPPAPAFSPHGLDLAPLPDGALRLLVVNHGGRESVEFFAVEQKAGATLLAWRGCAIPPPGTYMNDVVNLPDGGFLASHMMERESETLGMLRANLGFDTGFVVEWQPVSGFRKVLGTDAPFPNGIELSPDGRSIYLNVYAAGEVRRIDRETGELLASAEVPAPDNLSWSRDGRLLVASHRGGIRDQLACYGLDGGACPMAFEIVALDPENLEGSAIFSHPGGPPMGAGTVAIDLGDELLIGSFAGDRIIRVRSGS